MLKQDVMEPTTTERASPLLFARRKDGSLRFCDIYETLKAVATRDSFPLPRMDECIKPLGEVAIFSTIDANSGY